MNSPTHIELILNGDLQGVVSAGHLPAARAMARNYTHKGFTVRLVPRTCLDFLMSEAGDSRRESK